MTNAGVKHIQKAVDTAAPARYGHLDIYHLREETYEEVRLHSNAARYISCELIPSSH